jgi:hypothetical protein
VAGVTAAALAGALTLDAAGIGWVFASPVRVGALAMLLSEVLLAGFGGIPVCTLSALRN